MSDFRLVRFELLSILLVIIASTSTLARGEGKVGNSTDTTTGSVLVFCRTPKAASTSITDIMAKLSDLHGFDMYYESNKNNYWPSPNQLMDKLAHMPDGSLYVNHCYFLQDKLWLNRIKYYQGKNATKAALYDPRRYIWINTVRDPIERAISLYYYMIDESRRHDLATQELERRASKGICMCPGLEFNQCVIRAYMRCPRSVVDKELQIDTFYGARVSRTLGRGINKTSAALSEHMQNVTRLALKNAMKYHSIVLSSRIDLSFKLWSKTLPRWFGQYETNKHFTKTHQWASSYVIGNLTMNGAITNKARDILKSTPTFKAEYAFYNVVELMYYRKLANASLLLGAIYSARSDLFT